MPETSKKKPSPPPPPPGASQAPREAWCTVDELVQLLVTELTHKKLDDEDRTRDGVLLQLQRRLTTQGERETGLLAVYARGVRLSENVRRVNPDWPLVYASFDQLFDGDELDPEEFNVVARRLKRLFPID